LNCLTKLISFYDKVTRLLDEQKVVHIIYLDFSKAFDTVYHNILPAETGCCWLGQAYSSLDKKLSGCPGPKSGGEWS